MEVGQRREEEKRMEVIREGKSEINEPGRLGKGRLEKH